MSGNNLSDEALWSSIRSDNVAAFELLVERYWQAVYTTAYSYLEDRDMAMEIANDTFMSIWQKKGHLNISSFKAYLTTSARYHVYKVLRERKTLRLAYVADYESLNYLNAQNNEGEEKIRYMNLKSEIEEALQALPARCREIFLLSRLGELTNTEIAQKLSISKRTVENQISIAHRYLQQNSKDIALGLLLAFMIQ